MKNCPEPNQMTNTADGTNDTEHNQRTMDINDDNVLRGEINRSGPKNWKKNQPVYKRLKGEAFFNAKGKEIHAKTMGMRCDSSFCKKSKLRSCETLLEEDRTKILGKFWTMTSWEKRRSFVQALVHKVYFTTL